MLTPRSALVVDRLLDPPGAGYSRKMNAKPSSAHPAEPNMPPHPTEPAEGPREPARRSAEERDRSMKRADIANGEGDVDGSTSC